MVMNWKKYFIVLPFLSSFSGITVILKLITGMSTLSFFSTKNINFMTELFHSGGSVKNWNILKTEYALQNQGHFCWLQHRSTIPKMWKKCIKQTSEDTSLLVVKEHHLLRDSRIIILERLVLKNYIHS